MILFEMFSFAAPPRTGGAWFLEASSLLSLHRKEVSGLHSPSYRDGWYSVSMIRHPYDWLMSYYLSGSPRVGVPMIDEIAAIAEQCLDSSSFFRAYLQQRPGTVGRIFNSYKAHTVLKKEDLPWSAFEFFCSLGLKEEEVEKIVKMPRTNPGYDVEVDLGLKRAVVQAEAEFCEGFEYYVW